MTGIESERRAITPVLKKNIFQWKVHLKKAGEAQPEISFTFHQKGFF